jgi:hypothetical protein
VAMPVTFATGNVNLIPTTVRRGIAPVPVSTDPSQ